VRWELPHLEDSVCDLLQEELARSMVATGRTWFATVRHGGRLWLRFNLVNLHTREEHIRDLADLLYETARAMTAR
jgi:hypothetical protein